jgi:leucyl aminopeptidase
LGRIVGRDIGGADPERMAPPRVAEYIQDLFNKSSNIKVKKKYFILEEILRFFID